MPSSLRKTTLIALLIAALVGFMAGPAYAQDEPEPEVEVEGEVEVEPEPGDSETTPAEGEEPASGAQVVAPDPDAPSIAEVAAADGRFSTLVTALQLSGLADMFADCESGGAYTVLAPTDDAFTAALSALGLEVADLAADTELLTTILTYHVVEGAITSDVVATLDGASAPTVQGEDLTVAVSGDSISIISGNPTPANVIVADVAACNGVIHAIDNVLIPPTVAEALGLAAGEEEAAAEEDAEAAQEETTTEEELPATGTDSLTIAMIAATLVAAGALVVTSSRRLRTES